LGVAIFQKKILVSCYQIILMVIREFLATLAKQYCALINASAHHYSRIIAIAFNYPG